ncbi:MAG: DUF2157 domain-containing protein [Elusimicrobiota bacterium]|jgi:uncharacterized membrane protein
MADQSEDFKESLRAESAAWVQAGIISEDQRQRLMGLPASTAPQHRRLTSTIVTIGALLIGFGVILFFASNWQKIGPFAKMAVLLAALVASYATGRHIDKRMPDYPRVALAFFLLGAILFGANIFLVAQAYNISAHWPNGVLWWALGVAPFALLLSSRAMATVTVLGFSFWIGAELVFYTGHSDSMQALLPVFMLWGCCLLSLGNLAEKRPSVSRLAPVFLALGLFGVLVTAFFFTFKTHSYHSASVPVFDEVVNGRGLMFAYCGVFSVVAVAFSVWRQIEDLSGLGWWTLAACVWAWLSAALLPLGAVGTALVGNLIYFGGLVALLYIGYLRSQAYCVNLGLFAFAALVIGRYFDFAWRYMERSAAFIIGGLLLLLLGFSLERSRRRLLGGKGR